MVRRFHLANEAPHLEFSDPFDRADQAPLNSPLATGLAALDMLIAGVPDVGIVTIAGRPAMGSTALALQVAITAAELTCRPVLVASLGDSAVSMAIRAASLLVARPKGGQHGESAGARPRASAIHTDRLSRLRARGFAIKDQLELASNGLRETLSDIQSSCGSTPAVTVVDRGDLLSDSVGYSRRDADSGPCAHAQWLYRLSREFNTRIVATARVDKRVECRADRRPSLGDLTPESMTLALASEATLIAYRDEVYDDDSPDRGWGEIAVCSNRWGPVGRTRIRFEKGQWSEATLPA